MDNDEPRKTRLNITVDDGKNGGAKPAAGQSAFASEPPPSCSNGHAIYAYVGTRHLVRLGSSTCLDPAPGQSAASAGRTILIPSAVSDELALMMEQHPDFSEIRFSVCCPPPASIT